MKKILSFALMCAVCIGVADAAVRDENATNRIGNNTVSTAHTPRATTTKTVSGRGATTTARTATTKTVSERGASVTSRAATSRTSAPATVSRAAVPAALRGITSDRPRASARSTTTARQQTVSRAATTTETVATMADTQIGAEYEQCKSAYFTCMDQFCQLKNDDYRRCSCSNRVFELDEIRDVMQDASDQLTVFTENLDVVGMTAEQATAMKTASEGENALTSDTSASKALLQAIMNSIRGEDATVGGKFTNLNSINLSFDTTNAFGLTDAGQVIATYNGQNLYSAVYPQCREAVRADCTDAQLQRAINAYLMAIEQDCNTVASALTQQQSQMKAAVRESSAMLDLARVENRQKHNSDNMATCLANVEAAILSEEVCGANYHKCLDNGEFIDVSTGAPIAGVENFYELGNLLKFADNVDAADQKLSKVSSNRMFVKNFENRVKKFAEPALDKCVEDADTVWAEYLDQAMLDIYYAQQSKVAEIKQGCFDFVSACYMNGDTALTAAMAELTGDDGVLLQPDRVTLNTEMCRDYIDSCNMMFYDQTGGQNIVTDYINHRQETDTLTACRAVVQQCFDEFGGDGYENFYYPYSGLFKTGEALDWFTLYEYDDNGNQITDQPVSKCAKQLMEIASCNTPEIMEQAFGGFDVINASRGKYNNEPVFIFDPDGDYNATSNTPGKHRKYGMLDENETAGIELDENATRADARLLRHHQPRPTGVATEIYNQIVDRLTTQCTNVQGRFIELQFIKGAYSESNLCIAENFGTSTEYGTHQNIQELYGISNDENMCPRDYDLDVDTQSWGACLCWENGGRRSKWGTSPKCVAVLPVDDAAKDETCSAKHTITTPKEADATKWCTQPVTQYNQVCSMGENGTLLINAAGYCINKDNNALEYLPTGLQ